MLWNFCTPLSPCAVCYAMLCYAAADWLQSISSFWMNGTESQLMTATASASASTALRDQLVAQPTDVAISLHTSSNLPPQLTSHFTEMHFFYV